MVCKGAGGRGRDVWEAEVKEGRQGSRRQSKVYKGGRGRGRYVREAKVEEGKQGRQREREVSNGGRGRGSEKHTRAHSKSHTCIQ